MEIEEILSRLEHPEDPLARRVISIFDKDNDGSISLEEFVHGLSELYSNNEDYNLIFAFKVYDLDDDGFISKGELFSVLKLMVG